MPKWVTKLLTWDQPSADCLVEVALAAISGSRSPAFPVRTSYALTSYALTSKGLLLRPLLAELYRTGEALLGEVAQD